MELNEQTGNSVFILGQKQKKPIEEQKNVFEGRNSKASQYQSQKKGMVGITESVPKTKMLI